ncbi:hypothetical protein [Myroides guanonis]|uniref:Uncharacterized protein n=1 Tax=Myroides guanonis TaxID=1150112 RepID=A0A1I3PB49_9FLAO|nr:hypothetical protein [Myroides guanonis]SFJ18557.1 hypothetical protein SAMN04487893_10448 [Myroides guanonis]
MFSQDIVVVLRDWIILISNIMVRIKTKHIFLYVIGITLLIFGQRSFWEDFKVASKQKETAKKIADEALLASEKGFEVQTLEYDSIQKSWKNKATYFQTLHVGNVNFKALKRFNKTFVETNDDENASDSF